MLILAFGGDNVSVDSGSDLRGDDRAAICRTITEGGVLTSDLDLLHQAARRMLVGVLSCRENRSQSGPFARIAGEAIGASLRLLNMATEEFLSCLSRDALETAARTEGVRIEARAKDTRARMVTRFKDSTFVYPGALFRLTPEELEAVAERRHARSDAGWVGPATGDDGADAGEGEGHDADQLPIGPRPRDSHVNLSGEMTYNSGLKARSHDARRRQPHRPDRGAGCPRRTRRRPLRRRIAGAQRWRFRRGRRSGRR